MAVKKINHNSDFYVFTGSSVGVVPFLGKGIYKGVINKLGSVKHYKYKAKKVVDVSGAGDAFISVICHYFERGIPIFDCCNLGRRK